MSYINCQKVKAFELFDEGKRPSELFDKLPLKKTTLFRYFQEWKRKEEERERKLEMAELQKAIRLFLRGLNMDIDNCMRYPRPGSDTELVKWRKRKARYEFLLKSPALATASEQAFLLKYYSF